VAFAQALPEALGWLNCTKLACRLYGAAALPENASFSPWETTICFAATISVSARGTRSGSAASNGACRCYAISTAAVVDMRLH